MNKTLKTFLQIAFSLGLGALLIWMVYRNFTEKDKADMIDSFARANYWWIVLSSCIAVLSHIFRAYRWKFPLRQLGYDLSLASSFYAVMIGYLFNLAFPRLGEVTRCAVLARYQKMPFEKLFGTVIAERLVDLVVLIILILAAIFMQLELLRDFLNDLMGPLMEKLESLPFMLTIGVVGIAVAYLGWRFIQSSQHKVAIMLREKIQGLMDGLIALKRMKNKAGFLLHTVLIWTAYIVMYLVTFQAFPETQGVSFGGVLASFVLGGISLIAVQGGLGAYPLAVMSILILYGVDKNQGYAFGWIIWTAQTITILIAGFISMIALPFISKKKEYSGIADESLS
ncbi:MAG: flippase-like domain-containing protein [Salibacteraceae bacterium]|nr:flippase-like domain-containing protein [Salibacteraceae bacterium]